MPLKNSQPQKFDASVEAAMAKWPNVPSCYGWLAIDRRGHYAVPSGPLQHPALQQFIGRNYGIDDDGQVFFQNGPQRVFIDVAYTPYIARWRSEKFSLHTGADIGTVHDAYIDESGAILLAAHGSIALLDDRDLIPLVDAKLLDEESIHLTKRLPLQPIMAADVPHQFGFQQQPGSPEQRALS